MIRFAENFSNLAAGSQYTVDSDAVGVGKIVSDGGVNCLTHYHPPYGPHKPPARIPIKVQYREPSIDLGANAGHMIDIRLKFRLYDLSSGSGTILELTANISTDGADIIRFGHDGSDWFCYICAPESVIPAGSWTLTAAADTAWHTLRIVLLYNTVFIWFDDEVVGDFEYAVAMGYQTAYYFYAHLTLYSTSGWSVYYRWVDVIMSQVDLITESDDTVRVDGAGIPGATVHFFDQASHTAEYTLTAGQDGVVDIASVTTPGTYYWLMYDDLGYSGAGEYTVAGP